MGAVASATASNALLYGTLVGDWCGGTMMTLNPSDPSGVSLGKAEVTATVPAGFSTLPYGQRVPNGTIIPYAACLDGTYEVVCKTYPNQVLSGLSVIDTGSAIELAAVYSTDFGTFVGAGTEQNTISTLFAYGTFSCQTGSGPTLSSITPNQCVVNQEPSGAVTIAGSGFTALDQNNNPYPIVTGITFGGNAVGAYNVVNNTTIMIAAAAVPESTAPGAVNVVVTTSQGTASGTFTYILPIPTVTNVSSPAGSVTISGVSVPAGPAAGGTLVTVNGTGFTGTTGVHFGAVPASYYEVSSDTEIQVQSPASTVTGTPIDIIVTNTRASSVASANDQFVYVGQPVVTGVTPASGPVAGGTSVTISGSNFTGATQVSFGSMACTVFTVDSDTQITIDSPVATNAGAVDITVTVPIGGTSATSAADQFTYTSS